MYYKTEQLLAFIDGVQESYEGGDIIDANKSLDWKITRHDNFFMIKANWIIEIKKSPIIDNPIYQLEDEILTEDYFFKIYFAHSNRKFCAEIIEALEIVNEKPLIII